MKLKVMVKVESGTGVKIEIPAEGSLPENMLTAGIMAAHAEKEAKAILAELVRMDEEASPQGRLGLDGPWTLHAEPNWQAADLALLEYMEQAIGDPAKRQELLIEWSKAFEEETPEAWIVACIGHDVGDKKEQKEIMAAVLARFGELLPPADEVEAD